MTDAEKLEALREMSYRWLDDCDQLLGFSKRIVMMGIHLPAELTVSSNLLDSKAHEVLEILAK